jgi:arginine deiminase
MTPRHRERLLLRTLPWVSRARQEHDILCQTLRDQGVEVIYLTEMLQDTLEYQAARQEAIGLAVADVGLGDELRGQLRAYLDGLGPETLTQVLIAGLTPQELSIGRGVVFELLDRHDFVLDPLPNLIFIKDSSFWIGDRVAVASLAAERRRREAGLAAVVYQHHPRFAGTKWLYQPELEHVDGGDVLMLAPGVIAVGVGERTTSAGTERLARHLFDAGLAHSVLAVPMSQHGAAGHLDTICAIIDHDAVVMHPAVAYTLTAHTITPRPDGMRVSRPQPFLEAAALAMGVDRLRVIDTGTEPAAGIDQWDDGSNVLAIAPRIAVCHERNSLTNARLEDAGIEVIRVPGSELGSPRGGPRCMACPVGRDPAAMPPDQVLDRGNIGPSKPLFREALVLAGTDQPTSPILDGTEPLVPPVAAGPASRGCSGVVLASSDRPQLCGPRSADYADRHNDGGEQGKDEELASASLTGLGLSATASRPPPGPEHPECEGCHDQDQPDQEDPHQEVEQQDGDPNDHDRQGDQHQHAQHKYTVRPTDRICQAGVGRLGGPTRQHAVGRRCVSAA